VRRQSSPILTAVQVTGQALYVYAERKRSATGAQGG